MMSHAGALLFAKRHQHYSNKKRENFWTLHKWINGSLWISLLVWTIIMQWHLPQNDYPFEMRLLGAISISTGLFLVVQSRLLLGHNQAMGIRFFFPEKAKRITHYLYAYLNNPMYDGFILVFIGLALAFGITADFYLAGASFLLFNILLAGVENYEWKWNPF